MRPFLIPALVLGLFFTAIAILSAYSALSLRMGHQQQALINASLKITSELTSFHLWFEELIQGDPHITAEQVWQHFSAARAHAQSMLGADTTHGDTPSLQDPRLRQSIAQTLQRLDELELVGQQRLLRSRHSRAGSAEDEQFDTIFNAVLVNTQQVADSLQASIDAQRRQHQGSGILIGILLGLLALVLAFFLYHSRRTIDRASKALQASEQQYRAIFEACADAMLIIDEHCIVRAANPAAYQNFGYTDIAMNGLSLPAIVQCDSGPPCLMLAGQDSQALQTTTECMATHASGQRFHVEIRMSPFRYWEPAAMLAIIRDISARKKAERQLQVYSEQLSEQVAIRTAALETSNRELEALSHAIAHDLRTPLRAITSFAQIIEQDGDTLNSEARANLSRIIKAGKHMGQLIDDILELGMISRQELILAPLDISRMAREILDELRATQPRPNIDCQVEDGLQARGDKTALRRLLQNLLGNAWKFTRDAASPRICLYALRKDGQTVFVVEDNGVGFNMDYANKLFNPFQRLHPEQDFEGTGIGLATVARVIKQHGGAVWAESSVGTGSRFYFSLGPTTQPL